MAAVRSRDTQPEMVVRRTAHALGYRYRLHRRDLPGRPDLVFARLRLAIFVHGCFWHGHEGCSKATIPKSNSAFWANKLARNRQRDQLVRQALEAAGWKVEVLWECELKNPAAVEQRLREILQFRETAATPIMKGL